jgi:hypothetical protein
MARGFRTIPSESDAVLAKDSQARPIQWSYTSEKLIAKFRGQRKLAAG